MKPKATKPPKPAKVVEPTAAEQVPSSMELIAAIDENIHNTAAVINDVAQVAKAQLALVADLVAMVKELKTKDTATPAPKTIN